MAEVFKAKRAGVEGFEKIVAVKRILPHLSENKEFLDMFVDEAKMVAGLAHPNIVQIFDLGRIEKSYYIAMEYVHGRDLRTIMRRARDKGLRMPLDLSLRVVSQVCAALEYAHRKKDERGPPDADRAPRRQPAEHPDLVRGRREARRLRDRQGRDQGLEHRPRGAARQAPLHEPGAGLGPADRPAQRRVLARASCSTRWSPRPSPSWARGTEVSILELVRQCVITPAREINPRVPEALDRVIMKALARDPDERYQDAGQMQRGLERFLRERPPVSARDLARFLELLFDRTEREDGIGASAASPEGAGPGAHIPDPDVAGLAPRAVRHRRMKAGCSDELSRDEQAKFYRQTLESRRSRSRSSTPRSRRSSPRSRTAWPTLQAQKNAAKQIYDGACRILGVENDLEKTEEPEA